MSHNIELKNGAIFIGDAHFHSIREDLLSFLLEIEKNYSKYPQLFLLGDIADILISQIDYFVNKNEKLINTINRLSNYIEIIYIEGNHDFNLSPILDNKIQIITIENQPLILKHNQKSIALSHGDIFLKIKYRVFSKIIRDVNFLNFINFFDVKFNNFITKRVWKWLETKKLHNVHYSFKNMIDRKINNYKSLDIDIVLEAHYHQNKRISYSSLEYINLPAFAVTHQYLIFINNDFIVTNFSI